MKEKILDLKALEYDVGKKSDNLLTRVQPEIKEILESWLGSENMSSYIRQVLIQHIIEHKNDIFTHTVKER